MSTKGPSKTLKAEKPKSITLKGVTILNGFISFPLAQFGKLATAMGTGTGGPMGAGKKPGRPAGSKKQTATA